MILEVFENKLVVRLGVECHFAFYMCDPRFKLLVEKYSIYNTHKQLHYRRLNYLCIWLYLDYNMASLSSEQPGGNATQLADRMLSIITATNACALAQSSTSGKSRRRHRRPLHPQGTRMFAHTGAICACAGGLAQAL